MVLKEFITGNAAVVLTSFGNRLFPMGLIHAIGIELGLQSNTAPVAITHTILTLFSGQIIATIEMEAGTIGDDGH